MIPDKISLSNVDILIEKGIVTGKNTTVKETSVGNLRGCFEDEFVRSKMDQNIVVYKVEMHNAVDAGKEGGLFFGFSHIFPGTIGNEFFMTRGHIHQNKTRSEYYWCVKGQGALILMDKSRNCRVENVENGSLHYIDGSLAHRLVNTGNETLIVGACWSADAGYDYDFISDNSFSVRVKKINGKIALVPSSKIKS